MCTFELIFYRISRGFKVSLKFQLLSWQENSRKLIISISDAGICLKIIKIIKKKWSLKDCNLLSLWGQDGCQEFIAGGGSWLHLLLCRHSSGRGLRQFSTEEKRKKKDLQLQFELIPEVSSSAPSQLSQMFGRCSALSLAAGLLQFSLSQSKDWHQMKTIGSALY